MTDALAAANRGVGKTTSASQLRSKRYFAKLQVKIEAQQAGPGNTSGGKKRGSWGNSGSSKKGK
jgi:hypothetical protein